MKKLIVLFLILTACGPKFKKGDCVTPDTSKFEKWENAKLASQYNMLVLDVGQRKYQLLAPGPEGYAPAEAGFDQVDNSFIKEECPVELALFKLQFSK